MAGETKLPGDILTQAGLGTLSPYTWIVPPTEVQEKRFADLEANMQALQARVDALEEELKELQRESESESGQAEEAPRMAARAFTRKKEAVPSEVREKLRKGENPLRVYREHRHLTGQQLAEKIGVSQAYISQLETDRRAGTTEVMKKIANVLNVSLDRLV